MPSRRLLVVCMFVAGCGGVRVSDFDAGRDSGVTAECSSDLDCPLGKQCKSGKCGAAVIEDSGRLNICTRD